MEFEGVGWRKAGGADRWRNLQVWLAACHAQFKNSELIKSDTPEQMGELERLQERISIHGATPKERSQSAPLVRASVHEIQITSKRQGKPITIAQARDSTVPDRKAGE
jgi:hypothetical protein